MWSGRTIKRQMKNADRCRSNVASLSRNNKQQEWKRRESQLNTCVMLLHTGTTERERRCEESVPYPAGKTWRGVRRGVGCPAPLHTRPVSRVSDEETEPARPGDPPHSQLLPLVRTTACRAPVHLCSPLSCFGGVQHIRLGAFARGAEEECGGS